MDLPPGLDERLVQDVLTSCRHRQDSHCPQNESRIGQVVWDTKHGIWSDNEMVPAIIRTALTMRALSELNMKGGWLPVDTVATAILDLASISQSPAPASVQTTHSNLGQCDVQPDVMHRRGSCRSPSMELVYNVCSASHISWTHDFLPALSTSGLDFLPVSFLNWLDDLQSRAPNLGGGIDDQVRDNLSTSDPNLVPAMKLIEYFKAFSTRAEMCSLTVRRRRGIALC